MADQTINIPRDSTMNALAKDTTLASILAQLTAQQAKLQAITQALIDRDIIGNNSITGIGDGTLTGAVVSLNNGKQKTLVAGDNIAINQSTGRIDVTGMDVSYNDLDDVPEDIAFYGDETAGAVEEIDTPLYASDVVNDLVTGGVAVPLSAEQGKVLNQNLTECYASFGTRTYGKITTSTWEAPSDGFATVSIYPTTSSHSCYLYPTVDGATYYMGATEGLRQSVTIPVKSGQTISLSTKSADTDVYLSFMPLVRHS